MQYGNRRGGKQAEDGDGRNGTHQQGMQYAQSLRDLALVAVEEQAVVTSDPGGQQQGDQVKQ